MHQAGVRRSISRMPATILMLLTVLVAPLIALKAAPAWAEDDGQVIIVAPVGDDGPQMGDPVPDATPVPKMDFAELMRRRLGEYAALPQEGTVADEIESRHVGLRAGRVTPVDREALYQDCLNQLVIDPDRGWVKNHREYCTKGVIKLRTRDQNNEAIGGVDIPFTIFASDRLGSRLVDVTIRYEGHGPIWGTMEPDPILTIRTNCWDLIHPTTSTCTVGGQGTFTSRISQWPRDIDFTVSSPSTAGTGTDMGVMSAWDVTAQWNADVGTIAQTSTRFDSASYLASDIWGTYSEGSVFADVMPFQKLRLSDTAIGEQVKHIWEAWTRPEITWPQGSVNKRVPGRSGSEPLHRLVHDAQRAADNRTRAIAACKEWSKVTGNPQPAGTQCDEFPYKATYEGAARQWYDTSVTPWQWSVRYITASHNTIAGSQLGEWYTKDRIIDWRDGDYWDDFYIKVKS